MTPSVEAWARWAVPKASLTYRSALEASCGRCGCWQYYTTTSTTGCGWKGVGRKGELHSINTYIIIVLGGFGRGG